MTFSIKDFFSKCNQILSFLRIWSRLLKKSLIENFIFCVVSANMKKEQLLKTHFLPIKCQCCPHIETSQLIFWIFCANLRYMCINFPFRCNSYLHQYIIVYKINCLELLPLNLTFSKKASLLVKIKFRVFCDSWN